MIAFLAVPGLVLPASRLYRPTTREGRIGAVVAAGFSIIMICAALHRDMGLHAGDDVMDHGVWSAIYFSIVTFTTLGYGDLSPSGPLRMLAAAQALAGYVILGMTFALLMQDDRGSGRSQKPDHQDQEIERQQ